MKFTDTANLPGRRPGGNGPANHAEVRCAIELNIDLRALALGKLADGAKAIMTFRHGSTLVSLEALTDEEIQHALPCDKRTLTRLQLAALKAYAAKYGVQWRRKLADARLIGHDAREPDGHQLRQLRNTLGPSWLASSWRREPWG